MTIHFVITAPNETVRAAREDLFRATYISHDVRGPLDPDEAERVGMMQVEAGGLRSFCGSARVDGPTAQQIGLAHAPWLTIHENADFLDTWDFPDA